MMKTSHDTVPGSMFLVPGSCSMFRFHVLGSGFAVLLFAVLLFVVPLFVVPLFDCVQFASMIPNPLEP